MDMLAQITTNVLGFFLLVVFLRSVFWKKILNVLDERRQHIEEELQRTAQQRTDLAKLQEEYRQRIATIENEARVKIQQAILEGKRIAMEIQEHGRAQAQGVLTKAKETVEFELAKARVTLRDQIAEMTVEAVERILRKKLDQEMDQHLVEAVLDELEHVPSRS
jgi:F-type H+-transporting ATPase subunit b